MSSVNAFETVSIYSLRDLPLENIELSRSPKNLLIESSASVGFIFGVLSLHPRHLLWNSKISNSFFFFYLFIFIKILFLEK